MSGLEIVGLVLGVVPLVLDGLPKLISVVDTLRNAGLIREETARNIKQLTDEVTIALVFLAQIKLYSSTVELKSPQLAQSVASLFESFPVATERLRKECDAYLKRLPHPFNPSRRKLDEAIAELERQLDRLFRSSSLFLSYLQLSSALPAGTLKSGLRDGRYTHQHAQHPSHLENFLKGRFERDSSLTVWSQEVQLDYVAKVGEFDIKRIGGTKCLVVVENRRIPVERGNDSYLLAAKEVVQKLRADSQLDSLGILACHSANWSTPYRVTDFTVVYHFPSMAHPNKLPVTLRSLFRSADAVEPDRRPDVPLQMRLSLARDIANAVLFVHVAGLVHKNIRPETILAFPPKRKLVDTTEIEWRAFLTGFIESRGDDQASQRPLFEITPDDPQYQGWDRYLYQHPSRAGPRELQVKFTMLHDIYALGVVLLEVGLWQSLIGSTISVYEYTQGQWRVVERVRRPLLIFDNEFPRSEDPDRTQARLIRSARQLLPFAMGPLYTEVVVSCLTCMDGSYDDSYQGPRFIEQVLDRLDDIKL